MAISTTQGDMKLFQDLTDNGWADIRFDETDPTAVLLDDGLENYILISLLTDRKASVNDILPSEFSTRAGWVGDIFETNSEIGSRLWLRSRERLSQELYGIIKNDILEALNWMVEDDMVKEFIVNVTRDTGQDVPKNNLKISIVAVQDNQSQRGFQYFFNWENQVFKGV